MVLFWLFRDRWGSNHWVGSNAIGAVVDENTKVLGTNNLFYRRCEWRVFLL